MVRNLKLVYAAGFLIIGIASAIAVVLLWDVEDSLILHFDNYRGPDVLGGVFNVYAILFIGVLINCINLWLGTVLARKEIMLPPKERLPQSLSERALIPWVLGCLNIFLSILILMAVSVIISVN